MTPALRAPNPKNGVELRRAIDWVNGIGIKVHEAETWGDEHVDFDWGAAGSSPFLPGIWIAGGEIAVDLDEAAVGDFMHDVGHLAVLPPILRPHAHGDVESSLEEWLNDPEANPAGGALMHPEGPVMQAFINSGDPAVIAWTHAALRAARIDTHRQMEDGFVTVDVDELHADLEAGHFGGINELAAGRMIKWVRDYPRLDKWLQDASE